MTKREKNVRAIAKHITRAHGISKTQALELARTYTRAGEAADEVKEVEFTDGTKWRKK